ncbi:hypothetical protein [Lacimicrobium sp. SS2-24]|uniref:hypothetical protein n=1 Tax=Lacimicrobium sp. SS2-24 TaxID=2005569 RepID=UPI000B4BFF8C|nr:hypothetical protein [Lacimicrobium sp. SS2-24]
MPAFRFLLVLAFITLPVSAAPMVWLAEYDPNFEKAISMDEQTQQMILSGLEEVPFEVEKTHPKRGLKRLQTDANVCVGDKIYSPERQRFSLASALPQVVVPGLRLYLREDIAKKLSLHDDTTALPDFNQLMQQLPQLRIGIMQGRSYGNELDQALKNPRWQSNIWQRSGSDMGSGVVSMLMTGRVDGIFEFPNVFKHYSQPFSEAPAITPVRIRETPEYISGYVLCSRSEQGQQAIEAISARIRALSRERDYLDTHLQWFDEDIHQQLVGYYNQVYGTAFSVLGHTE